MLMDLPVERPVTTIMIFVGVALLGVISWTKLPQELFPSLAYPQISVVTKYEGAGPEEAEKLISKMVEETVGTVKGVRRVSSISKEGTSIVICEFRWGTDMNFASLDVREKIDLVKERLPKEAREPVVLKYNPFQMEAMVLSVSYNKDETDPWRLVELRHFCKKNIKDELERIDGVAKVEIRGGEQKEILVEVDKGRILANQVSLLDIIKTLKETNITYPAGLVKEEMYEYNVKTVGEFKSVQDISEVLLTKEDKQKEQKRRSHIDRSEGRFSGIIFLRDVARVHESIKDQTGISRYNQKSNVSLSIYPQSGSNLVNISKLIRKKMVDIKAKTPRNVEVKIIYDQAEFIKASLNNLYREAAQGSVLSFIVLYIFMKDMIASFIIIIAIPISILATLSMMYFSGITINSMSLGGIAVGVGMVVDSANVVLESIFVYAPKHPEKTKKEIIKEATASETAAVLSGALTSVAIFLPFLFVSGIAGQLFKDLALTITFSLLSSVVVALILIPRLALNLDLEKYKNISHKMKLLSYYPPLLTKFLKLPLKVTWKYLYIYLIIGAVFTVYIPKEFMPQIDERRFVLNITLPPQTTLAVTNKLVRRIEQVVGKLPETRDVVANIGNSGEDSGTNIESMGVNQARLIVRLKKKGRSSTEVAGAVSDEIKRWKVPKLETEFITQQGLMGSSVGSSSGLTIELKGRDLEELRKKSDKVVDELKKMPTIYGVKVIPSENVPELKLDIQRERASLFGLNVQDISSTILAAIKGYVATRFKDKEDEYDIRVRLRQEDRTDLSQVGELTVFSPFGRNIQLLQISDLNFVKSLPEIRRAEGQRMYLIMANVKSGFGTAVSQIKEALKEITPESGDISSDITGEMLALRESMSSGIFAIILGIIIVYMILASQFESLVKPIIVMITVPMGLVGGVYSLMLTFNSINSVSMQGMIMLIGNVVNSGIILIEHYNQERAEHPDGDLVAQVVKCTDERLRAILMTTLTTTLGLLPIALGIGEGAAATAPMAITIMGGLTLAMFLTLFFVPSAYIFVQRIIEKREERRTMKKSGDAGTTLPQETPQTDVPAGTEPTPGTEPA